MSDTEVESIVTLCDPVSGDSTSSQQIQVANRDALPFRHVKYIGQGSSAVIELVSHKSTNELFALKTFRRYYGRHLENAKKAFKNEVGIMERLSSHPHIIQVHGTFACDRELGMILSPVASDGDLGAYLATVYETELKSEHKVVLNRAFGCLISGLAYIHKHTIRHKDIKPQNILIHEGRVIYTDFGISFDADEQDTTTVGYPGAFTRRYCAPEVKDWANRNRKSDIFSLGCVFVEILDVLEPKIGFRCMDRLPYFEKLDEVRRRLLLTDVSIRARKGLFLVCHAMLEPDQVERIDTSTVIKRIAKLRNLKKGLFCDDCSTAVDSSDMASAEDLMNEINALSLSANQVSNDAPSDAAVETMVVEPTKKVKKKKKSSVTSGQVNVGLPPKVSGIIRLYCIACGESGHNSSKCPHKCWACSELYHKSADCPNKCWDCDEVGHFARDCPNKCWTCDKVGHQARNCPNECDACGKIGHPTNKCPNQCKTCGEVGHRARNCSDECFVCGKLGHATQNCAGKCHRCGKIGHWKKDCDDACFECGKLGHWAADCLSRSKKGKPRGPCPTCGEHGHWSSQCPKKKQKWQPIFDQVHQGPYRPKSRRQNQ